MQALFTVRADPAFKFAVCGALRYQIFKPELLNRLDETIIFNRLKPEHFEKICKIILSEIEDALLEKGITLLVSDEAIKALANIGYSEKYGARELRRTVSKKLGNKIAEKVVSDEAKFGSIINIGYNEDFVIDVK